MQRLKVIGLSIQLLVFGLLAMPAIATSQRYATTAEVRLMVQSLRAKIPQFQQTGYYQDRRTLAERQEQANIVRNWAKIDPAVAPFLGQWTAMEETKWIYPAKQRGKVCIIDSFIPTGQEVGYKFQTGKVVDGTIHTVDKTVLFKDGQFLGVVWIGPGEPFLYQYANPRPLKPLISFKFQNQERQIITQFRQQGCQAEFLQ